MYSLSIRVDTKLTCFSGISTILPRLSTCGTPSAWRWSAFIPIDEPSSVRLTMVTGPIMSQPARSLLSVPIQTVKSAKSAAASPHAVVNLIRLVKALENEDIGDDETPGLDIPNDGTILQTWRVSSIGGVVCISSRNVECSICSNLAGCSKRWKRAVGLDFNLIVYTI